MKKLLLGGVAVLALAAPNAALAANNYNPNPNASACGQEHGAFGAFGKDYSFAGGANGQATASLNSANGSAVHDPAFTGCV